ncbi:Alanine--glyoxylate aminotransferase 2, mitochondrial [Toxocara canis]|uniref:Alanine--glyoxylate aminotransferase 2, mitochondrial n=1 Tax=Toxocara canis TaxID=6265 RepID=A0A0B2V8N1_TOXCA|nr:Alanine--glyoxylate aminotransferase 2, mitochondrial [Toxocara canis]
MKHVRELRCLLPPAAKPYYKEPLLITKGSMQYLWDDKGKKYIDCFGGIVTVSVGHCHPKVNAALKEQLDKLWHTTSIYLSEPIFEYADKLTQTLPSHLKVCFFVNSGSEANDLALSLARLHTGRFDLLALRNGYHGLTQAVQGATSLGTWKSPLPSGFGILKAICPDPYRGPWGGKNCRDSRTGIKRECNCCDGQCQACEKYLAEFKATLKYELPASGEAAGVLIESIQGVGGVVQFPRGFVKSAFEAVRCKGGVCISDEVQTGFGRLGTHFWGFQGHDAEPDIVTLAKGIANGFPMGAVVTTKKIAESHSRSLYMNTFGGNPMACTVAKSVLQVIQEENLQKNCVEVGNYFMDQLNSIASPTVGDIRGKGLMIGVELVNEDGEPLDAIRMDRIFEETKYRGVLFGKGGIEGNVMRIKPPMCFTKADAEAAVDALASALAAVH